jgi:uncharacterized protein YjbJ (UPF0337 family)
LQPGHDFFVPARWRRGDPRRPGTSAVAFALFLHERAERRFARNETLWRYAMNWDQIEGNWMKAKGKLRQQWGKLTDDDITLINGKREELTGRLQERYGYQKEQAEKEIDSWMKKAS